MTVLTDTTAAREVAAEGRGGGDALPPEGPGRRRHPRRRLVLGAVALVIAAGVGVFAYLWTHSGAHQESLSTAITRFHQGQGQETEGGPAAGVYLYRGTGTESISVPPKSQNEGPGIPGTIRGRPGGCFEFRMDFSTAHWQSSTYCTRDGALVNRSRGGYYKWDFVAFSVDDSSTITCTPAVVTIPSQIRRGQRTTVSCTTANDHISIGPVHMRGISTVIGVSTLRVGRSMVPAVEIREHVAFSGGQHGTNDSDTWFSIATGMPLRGTWSTNVSTPSVVGTTTLNASGTYTLTSLTPQR
ncbi:MAG TPA: hypothetical protein VNG12_21700 [Acidimicrobiales bacterium]|nr:hypothetical protein [Acidimicrobiales bacterium]